ncbi:hypothetical protein SAMN05421542_3660 [Chryseobacterium jejuense]|uniref:Uncharacterized protein n=1 Tax=Chryseobacterium jejuense TaxID=445960 RepID=A0A2X2X007_CHRJE|nr:hypothetical protein SAMN05421542_3660 [Chryseobacterium jejuense]SQB46336.1 Uncharacterised protein [Chryseobacterium jejuense]
MAIQYCLIPAHTHPGQHFVCGLVQNICGLHPLIAPCTVFISPLESFFEFFIIILFSINFLLFKIFGHLYIYFLLQGLKYTHSFIIQIIICKTNYLREFNNLTFGKNPIQNTGKIRMFFL